MSLLGSRLNNLFLIFFMKGLFMKIYFSNENLSADTKFMLEKEFIKRRIFANDIYYPLIEKWDKEYTKLHCDEEKNIYEKISSVYSF